MEQTIPISAQHISSDIPDHKLLRVLPNSDILVTYHEKTIYFLNPDATIHTSITIDDPENINNVYIFKSGFIAYTRMNKYKYYFDYEKMECIKNESCGRYYGYIPRNYVSNIHSDRYVSTFKDSEICFSCFPGGIYYSAKIPDGSDNLLYQLKNDFLMIVDHSIIYLLNNAHQQIAVHIPDIETERIKTACLIELDNRIIIRIYQNQKVSLMKIIFDKEFGIYNIIEKYTNYTIDITEKFGDAFGRGDIPGKAYLDSQNHLIYHDARIKSLVYFDIKPLIDLSETML